MNHFGYFLFSLDLEFATGYFDLDKVRHKKFSRDGLRERDSVRRLIGIFEQYDMVGTWAIVGHLFYDKCEYCSVCPMTEWRGQYSSFDEVYGTNHPLWCCADIIDTLLAKGKRQEIAFHGYSHRIFDESSMGQEQARIEIQEWHRVSKRKGITARAVVFPRNVVGHLAALQEAGFICFRAEPKRPPLISNKRFGRYVKAVDQILSISRLPLFDVAVHQDDELIPLPSSECFFDLDRRFELCLDALNLHNLRLKRIRDGIKRAAREKKMIHLWAHPHDFSTEKDFMKLQNVLDTATEEIQAGKMRSVGMSEMAQIIREMSNHQPCGAYVGGETPAAEISLIQPAA